MGKLITVEYNPASLQGTNPISRPTIGCVGETSRELLNQALRRLRSKEANDHQQLNKLVLPSAVKVPVRFPLNGLNSKMSFWMNGRDPEDELQLAQEGEMLSPLDLFPTDKKPVSLYEKRELNDLGALEKLFESEYYLQTYSKTKLLKSLTYIASKYPESWVWYQGQSATPPQYDLFYGARFYGLDTLINTYDPTTFSGVVLEIASRQQPDPSLRDLGVCNLVLKNDVFFFSNIVEYAGNIDGIDMGNTKVSYATLEAKINYMRTAKQLLTCQKEPKKDVMAANNTSKTSTVTFTYKDMVNVSYATTTAATTTNPIEYLPQTVKIEGV